MQNMKLAVTVLALSLASAPALIAQPDRTEPQIGFLTGPKAGDAKDIATRYLAAQREALGLTEADLADAVVEDQLLQPAERHHPHLLAPAARRGRGVERRPAKSTSPATAASSI